jgi:hypothetical protein
VILGIASAVLCTFAFLLLDLLQVLHLLLYQLILQLCLLLELLLLCFAELACWHLRLELFRSGAHERCRQFHAVRDHFVCFDGDFSDVEFVDADEHVFGFDVGVAGGENSEENCWENRRKIEGKLT